MNLKTVLFASAVVLTLFQLTCNGMQCGDFKSEIDCVMTNCVWEIAGNYCKCQSTVKLDILFGIDVSSSIGANEFEVLKTFLEDLATTNIGNSVQMGFDTFDTNTNLLKPIQAWDVPNLQTFIGSLQLNGGQYRNIKQLIQDALDDFAKSETVKSKLFFIITAGDSCLPDNCPLSVCDKATEMKQKGIRVVIIGIGSNWNAGYLSCLTESSNDVIPVAQFTAEDLDSISGTISAIVCPSIVKVTITEVKAEKNEFCYRCDRFVEIYNEGYDFDADSDILLNGLVNGTTPVNTYVQQGQYLVFYDKEQGWNGNSSITCHLCDNLSCDLSNCNEEGCVNSLGVCLCDNSIYIPCGNTGTGTCGAYTCCFDDSMINLNWNLQILESATDEVIDEVIFVWDPWSPIEDGYSFELLYKGYDNSKGDNWAQSCNKFGTPGSDPIQWCNRFTCTNRSCAGNGANSSQCFHQQCDCGLDNFYYPSCNRGACRACKHIPEVQTCQVTWIKTEDNINGIIRYAKYEWTDINFPADYGFELYYFSESTNGFLLPATTNGETLKIIYDYYRNNYTFGGYVQTVIEQCFDKYGNGNSVCETYYSSITWCTVNTQSPTQSPSYAPTIITFTPTYDPTLPNTLTPSDAPTTSPSAAPTQLPSNAPTNYPTITNPYTKTQKMNYIIRELTEANKDTIQDQQMDVYSQIIKMIETAYVNVAINYEEDNGDNEAELQYRYFQIIINSNKLHKDFTNSYSLTIRSTIHYNDEAIKRLILFVSYKRGFIQSVQSNLINHFGDNNAELTFEAKSIDDSETTSFDYVFYSLLTFMAIMTCISFIALMFNKKTDSKIDNANWAVLIIFGLQVFDLVSDINLSVEILLKFNNIFELSLLYIAGYGSVIFIVIPYIVNIFVAVNIKNMVSGNNVSVSYFEQRSALFISLVVFSGASYPSLALLSSRLFGIELFNSGLTSHEMRNLVKLKVFGNVILENIPQTVCQILYIIYLKGEMSQNTTLALVTSFLSIIGTILSYFVQNKNSDCYVSQYDLQLIKTRENTLTNDEIKLISHKKERKAALRKLLCSALNVEQTNIELGYVKTTNNGFILHVIHYTIKTELDSLDSIVNKTSVTDTESEKYEKLVESFTKMLYEVKKQEVNASFNKHFGFDDSTFIVQYFTKFGYGNLLQMNENNTRQLNIEEQTYNEDSISEKYDKINDLMTKIKTGLRQNKNGNEIENSLINVYDKQTIDNAFMMFQVTNTTNTEQIEMQPINE
eukprot:516812_1